MSSSFWLLGFESRDFSQVEKKKELLANLRKFTKGQLLFLKIVLGCLLSKNS